MIIVKIAELNHYQYTSGNPYIIQHFDYYINSWECSTVGCLGSLLAISRFTSEYVFQTMVVLRLGILEIGNFFHLEWYVQRTYSSTTKQISRVGRSPI